MKRFIFLLCTISCLLSTGVSQADESLPLGKNVLSVSPMAQSAPLAVQSPSGFPIRFSNHDIFSVTNSPIRSLSQENRAKLILNNIQKFADSDIDSHALKVINLPDGFGIGVDDNILMVISESDAVSTGKTAEQLALQVLDRLQTAVEDYRNRRSLKTYGLGAMYTILAIIGLWLALYWNNRAYAWTVQKVTNMEGVWKKEIQFKNVKVLSKEKVEFFVLFALRLLRIFVALLCLYFFMPLILSFFPETRNLGARIFEYLITPFSTIFHTVIKYIPNFFFIFVIAVIAFYSLKLISYIFKLIEHGELKFEWFYEDWARPTYQIIRFLVIVTALISAYPYIPGSSSQAFQGVGLVLGAIISFASSSAISNIVAGVILTYTRAFKLMDRIKIGDTIGDVVDKTLLVTRIKTIKHVVVTIPNSLVMGSQIINFSTSAAEGAGVILHTSVTIGYDVPWKQVQSLLIEAATATKGLLQNPAPFVLQTSLDDFYISYEINAYTKEPEIMANIYSELHENILAKFDAASVEIMSPHYYALRDGNAAAVPSILATKGYKQPAFQVNSGSLTD